MTRKTLVAGLVAMSLLAGMIGGTGVAEAATASVLTVTPVEPNVADVCWTPYRPRCGFGEQLSALRRQSCSTSRSPPHQTSSGLSAVSTACASPT